MVRRDHWPACHRRASRRGHVILTVALQISGKPLLLVRYALRAMPLIIRPPSIASDLANKPIQPHCTYNYAVFSTDVLET